MKLMYDYSKIINELQFELKTNRLHSISNIQIIRSNTPIIYFIDSSEILSPINIDYYPIIDWYYNEERMLEFIIDALTDQKTSPYVELLLEDLVSKYGKDKHRLISVTVLNCLDEIESFSCF